MASTQAQIRAAVKWKRENMKRIPLDLYPEQVVFLKDLANTHGETVGGLLKKLIAAEFERIAADGGPAVPAAWDNGGRRKSATAGAGSDGPDRLKKTRPQACAAADEKPAAADPRS